MDSNEILRIIVENKTEFALGFDEFPTDVGVIYDNDPWSDRSMAYDLGRSLAEALNPDWMTYTDAEGIKRY